MASLELFHVSPARGILNKTDSRIKLPIMLLYTTIMYGVSGGGLLVLAVIIVTAFISTRPSLMSIVNLRGLWVLSALIFSAAWFSSYLFMPALIVTGRFILTVLLGSILIRTTFPEEIESAIYWYLNPVPFISASAVATRFRLTLTFIPELFETSEMIREAREARYIKGERNPLKRVQTLISPLLLGIITKAEETSLALESRCYTGETPILMDSLKLKDVIILALNAAAAGIALYI